MRKGSRLKPPVEPPLAIEAIGANTANAYPTAMTPSPAAAAAPPRLTSAIPAARGIGEGCASAAGSRVTVHVANGGEESAEAARTARSVRFRAEFNPQKCVLIRLLRELPGWGPRHAFVLRT